MIGAILAAGGLILNVGQAIAESRAQARQKRANTAAANDAFSETSHALALRGEQEALASAQQVYEISRSGTQQRGSLAAGAASAGVEGSSVNALEAELVNREFNARDITERNLSMTQQEIQRQKMAAGKERDARVAGVEGPSNIATGLKIGGALTAFGYDWLKMKPNGP